MKNKLFQAFRIVITPIAVVLSVFVSAGAGTLKFKQDLSAEEVVTYLREFMEGTGGNWDWDDFTSLPIRNPRLDSIRMRAKSVDLPITDKGLKKLRNLLREAEQLVREQP